MPSHPELDDLDLRILDVVQRSPPMSTAELAERVGLSQSPCWRRLSRLKEDGYILDQTTRLNAEKLGFRTMVFAAVKLSAHGRANLNEFIEAVSRLPEVLEVHPTMGPFDFLLRVVTGDVEDYREFAFGRLLTLPTVQEINSTMSLGPAKMTSVLPIRPR
ncbi:MAG TPA: Lrp/AsnC family transcriptional regulator [Phenylobacterium sp.]|nr:Lrp/AsnC family transcriptional regulator [Phenylobacterium sp.]